MMAEKDKLKNYRASQKKVHDAEINEQITQVYKTGYEQKRLLAEYHEQKRMKWWSWLAILIIVGFGVGFSYLTGWLAIDSAKAPNWQAVGWFSLAYTALIFAIIWVLGLIKNREAAKYFNDRRRRYQKTFQDWEAKIQLIRKILTLSFLLMMVLVIVSNIVYH